MTLDSLPRRLFPADRALAAGAAGLDVAVAGGPAGTPEPTFVAEFMALRGVCAAFLP